MLEVRPATAVDVDAFFGSRPRPTVTAFVAVEDGKVIAVGGLAREGVVHKAFWDIAPGHESAMRSMAVLRTVKRVMRLAAMSPLPVVAAGDNPALLERLGFESIGGDVYQWAHSPKPRARRMPAAQRESLQAKKPDSSHAAPD